MASATPQQEAPLPPSRLAPGYSESEQQQQQQQATRQPGADSGSSSSSFFNKTAATASRLTTGQMPCAKRSLLTGIGAGIGITAVGALAGRKMLHASNWGAGAFVLVSLGTWQICRSARAAEATRMKMIIEQHNRRGSGAQDKQPSA